MASATASDNKWRCNLCSAVYSKVADAELCQNQHMQWDKFVENGISTKVTDARNMNSESGIGGSGVCPVCCTNQSDISVHLATHTKEEIIQMITLRNASVSVAESPDHSQAGDQNAEEISEQQQIPSNMASDSTNSGLQTNAVLSSATSDSGVPLIPVLSNSVATLPSSHIASGYSPLRCSQLPSGSVPSIQQLAAPPFPVIYRPTSSFQNINETNTSPILLPNSHMNLNAYKILGNHPVLNSFPMPPFLNQSIQQQPAFPAPSSSCQIQQSVNTSVPSVKLNSNSENVSGQTQAQPLSSNIPSSAALGPQPVFCVLPYTPAVQPPVDPGGNFVFYGGNFLPMNTYLPEVTQGQVNYVLPNNNGLLMNGSFAANQAFLPPANFGMKQMFACPPGGRTSVSNNVAQASDCNQNSLTAVTGTAPPNGTGGISTSFANAEHPNALNLHEKEEPSEAVNCENSTAVIEIGKNVKINIPKDVLSRKERVKELINRELVRALLINDSEELEELSDSDSVDSLENKLGIANTAVTKEDTDAALQSTCKRESSVSHDVHYSNSVPCKEEASNYVCHEATNELVSLNDGQIHCSIPSLSTDLQYVNSQVFRKDDNVTSLEPTIQVSETIGNNSVFYVSADSHLNTLFSKSRSPTKIYISKHLPSLSRLSELNNSVLKSEDTKFSDHIVNCLDDNVLNEISYTEDHVLGAVEEVFASESVSHMDLENSTTIKTSNLEPSDGDADSLQIRNIEVDSLVESNDAFDHPSSFARNSLKTYRHKRRQGTNLDANLNSWHEIQVPSFLASNCTFNSKLQEDNEEETVDDPNFDEDVNLTCEPQEGFLRDDSISNDSKEVQDRDLVKLENGESNGTQTEEVMSLKASETLADSDSERATPMEEVGEIFYGKSCIFAGEPGPPHLSPRVYMDSNQSEQNEHVLAIDQNFSMRHPSIHSGENSMVDEEVAPDDEPISLTLDGNCCILPVDALGSFIQDSSKMDQQNITLNEEWTKPLMMKWSKSEDLKPVIANTALDNYASSISPHASTSGLQNTGDVGIQKKCFRDDEESYDLDYESDCYGDSDSDFGHSHRVLLDLDRWRCSRCKKTFKSLKEKLLHSGHHSPCTVEHRAHAEQEAGQSAQGSLAVVKEDLVGSTEMLPPSNDSSARIQRALNIKMDPLKFELDFIGLASADSTEFKCTECPQTFNSVDKLYEHRAMVFKSRYICPLCHMEFKRRIDKIKHLKTHPPRALKCIICNRSFESLYTWSQHQLLHIGLIAYECKECGYKCRRRGELAIHYRKHSGERPFKCETCSSTFITGNSLKRHLIIHLKDQETECDICHKKYKNSVGLSKHKLKAHSKKRKFLKKRTDFMCTTCSEVFPSEKKLAWHQEVHERWPKKCQQCGECFIHQSSLTKHIRLKHDSAYIPEGNKDNMPCPVCQKVYKKSSLIQHMRIHTGDKPYKCNMCDKQFSVKCNYLSHKWVHMGIKDRPLKCKLCERSFHRRKFLESHIRSHKKIRPYTCNECGKSFIHKNNYRTHVRQHTEEKQHKCEFCGKTFHRKYNLNNHVRIHTGETPHECSHCGKFFTQKSNYNVHMKAFHGERRPVHEEV